MHFYNMHKICILFVFIVGWRRIAAIPIDNGVEGDPNVQCGAEGIEVTFKTRNPFNGRLYVKGRYGDEDCHNEQIGRMFTGISLSFGTCNLQRLRSLNPRGIFAIATVVISFHPLFVTKVDRVYKVQCFYMEAEKTVSQEIKVSDITTAFVTHLVPMPVCRYEVLDGGPTGPSIQFAVVGQQVYHKWTCDSETADTFCMIVHTCVVDDGKSDIVPMLDENGCALDRFVLNNLEYPTDLIAGQEAHVFKYADRSMLFFQCKISITLKEEGTECARPQCRDLTRAKRHSMTRRAPLAKPLPQKHLILDVTSQPIDTLDSFFIRQLLTDENRLHSSQLALPDFNLTNNCALSPQSVLFVAVGYFVFVCLIIFVQLAYNLVYRKL